MQTYRVYKLNPAGRIVSGDWIEAPDESTAWKLAHEMCDAFTPTVELWRGAQRLGLIPCEEHTAPHA